MSSHARSRPARRRVSLRWAALLVGVVVASVLAGTSDLPARLLTASSSSCQGTATLQPVARVNIGGPAVTVDGKTWSADPAGVTPSGPALDGVDVAGTDADVLYRTGVSRPFAYGIPVPAPGRYVTRLYFAETQLGTGADGRAAGRRVFSVTVDGRPVVQHLDIAARYGSLHAVVRSATTTVRGRKLAIRSVTEVGQPVLDAVEVLRRVGPDCAPVTSEQQQPAGGTSATAQAVAPTPAEQSPAPGSPSPDAQQSTAGQGATASSSGRAPSTRPTSTPAAPAAGAGAGQPAGTVAPQGSALLAPLTALGGRPFAPSAAWNQPLPATTAVDPNSAAMVASITGSGTATANLYAYGDPVFTADASSPTATVDCTENWGTCALEGHPVRIPADAQPTSGSDGRMIVVDPIAGTSCDFWQARKAGSGHWTVSWGTCAPLNGDGRAADGGSTGAGVNALTGVVRTFEIRNGVIPHALSVATGNSCSGTFRSPAVKTDGSSSRSDCVPEGARLQLDPSVDVDAIPGITPGERAVAHALQAYGAINRDNCGSNLCVSFEAPIAKSDPYPSVGFSGDYYTMPHIPWKRLRVVRG